MTIRRVPRYGISFLVFADDRVVLNGAYKFIIGRYGAYSDEGEGKDEKERKKKSTLQFSYHNAHMFRMF